MKTITIPKSFGYPTLDIIINGKKHTLQSGIEITVEDALAEVIENAMALAPKYARNISSLAQRVEGSIEEITLSDLAGVESIGLHAFSDCSNLSKIELPNNIKGIGNAAFSYCASLTNIVIPNSVIYIGEAAFYGCNGLTSIKLPDTPPTLDNINAFKDINASCIFYCKSQASLNAYKAASNWSTLAGTYTFAVEP